MSRAQPRPSQLAYSPKLLSPLPPLVFPLFCRMGRGLFPFPYGLRFWPLHFFFLFSHSHPSPPVSQRLYFPQFFEAFFFSVFPKKVFFESCVPPIHPPKFVLVLSLWSITRALFLLYVIRTPGVFPDFSSFSPVDVPSPPTSLLVFFLLAGVLSPSSFLPRPLLPRREQNYSPPLYPRFCYLTFGSLLGEAFGWCFGSFFDSGFIVLSFWSLVFGASFILCWSLKLPLGGRFISMFSGAPISVSPSRLFVNVWLAFVSLLLTFCIFSPPCLDLIPPRTLLSVFCFVSACA